ncbi:MAG: CHAT domain-containing protein [Acidimicrobiia bacterium]
MTTADRLMTTLLATASPESQLEAARGAGLLDQSGVEELLATVAERMSADLGEAGRAARVAAFMAEVIGWEAGVAQALYLEAQVLAMGGDLPGAGQLISQSREGFVRLGMELEALRTNLGLIHIQNELGEHEEALETAASVLAALDQNDDLALLPQAQLTTGLAHQNRAACLISMGRYQEAASALSRAGAVFRRLGADDRLAEVANNQAIVLHHLGRPDLALSELQVAADYFDQVGARRSHAQAVANLGEAHMALGNYSQGLSAFQRADRVFTALGADTDRHLLFIDAGDGYLSLNLYPEALDAYRRAGDYFTQAGMTAHRARALLGMGHALLGEDNSEEAYVSLTEAGQLFEEAGNSPLLAAVLLELANLAQRNGDRKGALADAQQALSLVDPEGAPLECVYAHLRLADLLDPEAAQSHLLEARHLVESLPLPPLKYRLHQRIGRLRLVQGKPEEARQELEQAVAIAERLRPGLSHERLRTSFAGDKTAAYEDLISLHLASDTDMGRQHAFDLTERARSRTLVDLLLNPAVSPTSIDPPELAQLRVELDALYNQAQSGSGDRRRLLSPARLRQRAVELEREIRHLMLRSGLTDGPLSERGPSPTLEPTEGTAVVAYYRVGSEIMAFCLTPDGLHVVRSLVTTEDLDRQLRRLHSQWNRFRSGLAERHAETLIDSARRILFTLYQQLIEPLLPNLDPATTRLVIVPHGPLHRLPFHALFDGQRYMIDRYQLSYAPSASVFQICRQRRPQRQTGLLAMAVPDPRIPGCATEAEAVVASMGPARLLMAEEATKSALESEAPGATLVHFACHGLFRHENPMFSALRMADGWFTAAEASGLGLKASLVTLSACESGRTRTMGGDEPIGLPRAFLAAGAGAVVASLWLVEDELTSQLMPRFYGLLAEGLTAAAALRRAQLEFKEKYPHPYRWAPFSLLGNPDWSSPKETQ